MNIQELLNRTDRFAANAGCRITEVDEHHAVAEMTVTAEHLNGGNVCQGGALFTLADLAIAALLNQSGQLTVGISNNIVFVTSAKLGDILRAEAIHVCDHHKIPSWVGQLMLYCCCSSLWPALWLIVLLWWQMLYTRCQTLLPIS